MEDQKSLTFRLESYLMQLSDINRRWMQWLTEHESSAVSRNTMQLLAMEGSAQSLFGELAQIVADREQLLADAKLIGLDCSDLSSLARKLPAWEKPTLRNSLATARAQISNLQRLHVATWVVISQAGRFYGESMHLLLIGNHPHVYTDDRAGDLGGGRLLDASL